jgi:hypothetical protein
MSICEKMFIPLKSVTDVEKFRELLDRYKGREFNLSFDKGVYKVILHKDALITSGPDGLQPQYTFADLGDCLDAFGKPRLSVKDDGLCIDLSPYF